MPATLLKRLRVREDTGADDVTDGSVDYYDTDWQNTENEATEEEMQKCFAALCGQSTACPPNSPQQTDTDEYEIVADT